MFKWITRFKSAVTGRFVKEAEAVANPATTVATRRKRAPKKVAKK